MPPEGKKDFGKKDGKKTIGRKKKAGYPEK